MINAYSKKQLSVAASFLMIFSLSSSSWSCTRLLHVDPNQGVMVGRNMDWFDNMSTNLIVYPRGLEHQGGDPVNPVRWKSQYGSIAALYHDVSATDGMNEKGFSAHILWLENTDYGVRDESIPGLSLLLWTQFYLDNFQTVNEAVAYTQSNHFQLIPFTDPFTHMDIKVHLAIEDATGDSAIIEYKNGEPVIYHDPQYKVLTNDPTYDLQLENMQQYNTFGGDKFIPGTDKPTDRFVRAAFHEKQLPFANTIDEEVNNMMSILENVSHPSEYFRGTSMIENTIWRTFSDLTHHVYYFNSTKHYTMNYTRLDQFNLNPGSPMMILDLVNHPELSGDVTNQFRPIEKQL